MRVRRWTEQDLRQAVRSSTSIRQVLGKLGLQEAGGNYDHIKKYLKEYSISIDHFTGQGWSKGMSGIGRSRLPLKEILVKGSSFQSYKLKKRLYEAKLKKQECEKCGWAEKSIDGRIPLELDHVNGDSSDNRIQNLRILCPNCHSLEPTHKGRNRQKESK